MMTTLARNACPPKQAQRVSRSAGGSGEWLARPSPG